MTRTPKQYSDEIEALTALIDESGITPVLFEAASQRDVGEMEEFVEQLKKEHAELWELMEKFYTEYCEDGYPKVFCKESDEDVEHVEGDEDNGYLVVFPEKINLESFVMLLFLSDERVSDMTLFEDFDVLNSRLIDANLVGFLADLADYQYDYTIENLKDLVRFAHGVY